MTTGGAQSPDVRVGQIWQEVEKPESRCRITAVAGEHVYMVEDDSGYEGPIARRWLPKFYRLTFDPQQYRVDLFHQRERVR